MFFGGARIFQSPFLMPTIYCDPFEHRPAYERLQPHWLSSPLGHRFFVELLRGDMPSPLWPPHVTDAVIDAVADALLAAVVTRRQKDSAS